MEFGLREWLIVIGIIVIAGILFDGWRRMRGGKGKLKFKLDRSFAMAPTSMVRIVAPVMACAVMATDLRPHPSIRPLVI